MILINLLPHREEARKKRREAFNVGLVAAVVVGALLGGLVYSYYQSKVSDQQRRNAMLKDEIKTLEEKIKEISTIETEIAALKARQKAVEDLQSDRNAQVHLMNELVKQLPDGVYITSMKQEGQNVLIQGTAQSNERVSELLRNFSNGSQWFTKPELVEIQSGSVTLPPKDMRRVSNFNMRVQLLRASDLDKSADAAAPKN